MADTGNYSTVGNVALRVVVNPDRYGTFVSDEILRIFQWVFYAVLTETIDVFGTVTNIINVVCFVKQGFKESVKTIFTHKRVTIIIMCIFIVLSLNFLPLSYVNRLTWKFSNKRNKTLIGLSFTEDREIFETVTFAISNVFVQLSAFLLVVTCTIILVVKLRDKSKWRDMAARSGQTESASSRDQKVTKMVIIISTLFIVCFIPICLIIVGMLVEPELSIEGKYRNLFISICSIGFALESTNSATNIFIYYHMSTRYRSVLRQTFLGRD